MLHDHEIHMHMHTTHNGYIHVCMPDTRTHTRTYTPKKSHRMQEHVHNYKCAYTGTHAYMQICAMKMPYCMEAEL